MLGQWLIECHDDVSREGKTMCCVLFSLRMPSRKKAILPIRFFSERTRLLYLTELHSLDDIPDAGEPDFDRLSVLAISWLDRVNSFRVTWGDRCLPDYMITHYSSISDWLNRSMVLGQTTFSSTIVNVNVRNHEVFLLCPDAVIVARNPLARCCNTSIH